MKHASNLLSLAERLLSFLAYFSMINYIQIVLCGSHFTQNQLKFGQIFSFV